jgi:hypothetical protein
MKQPWTAAALISAKLLPLPTAYINNRGRMSKDIMNRSDAPSVKPRSLGQRDHWQQEKEKLTSALTERILQGREHIVFSELHHAEVPEMVHIILRNHARELIRQEKPLVLQSKRRFELDDPEIRTQLRKLRDMLAERLVFEKSELQTAIAFAVRLHFDVITKPRATLENLIYNRSAERTKEDIVIILQGLSQNNQFLERIHSLLTDYPDGPVTKEAFSALCRRAEREVYGMRPVSALIADLQEYQRLRAGIEISDNGQIENQTVLGMLYERGLRELAESLLPELTQQESWSISEIEHLLEHQILTTGLQLQPEEPSMVFVPPEVDLGDFLQKAATEMESQLVGAAVKDLESSTVEQQATLDFGREEKMEDSETPAISASLHEMTITIEKETVVSPAPAPEPEAEPPAEATTPQEMSDSIPVVVEPNDEIEEDAQETPTQVSEVGQTASLSNPLDVSPAIDESYENVEQKPNQPRIVYDFHDSPAPKVRSESDIEEQQLIEHAKIEAQPPGPYPSLTKLIDEKKRRVFIKKVFQKKLDAYLSFIERLEPVQAWKEAKALLDHEFQQHKVNPYSKEAVQLSDLVFSRYFTKRSL